MRVLIALALAGCSAARTIPSAPVAPPVAANAAPDDELAPQLRIAGNRAFDTQRLRREVGMAPCNARREVDAAIHTAIAGKDTPACGTPEGTRVAVEIFYQWHGYIDARATLTDKTRVAPATIAIDEGRRYHLGSIVVVDKLDAADRHVVLDGALGLSPGQPVARDSVRAAIDRVEARYDEAGYGLVTILPLTKVDSADHRVDLTLEIDRGPLAQVVAIEVTGARADHTSASAPELAGLIGSVFSNRELRRAEQRLRATGKFTRVAIEFDWAGDRSRADQVKLIVQAD